MLLRTTIFKTSKYVAQTNRGLPTTIPVANGHTRGAHVEGDLYLHDLPRFYETALNMLGLGEYLVGISCCLAF